MPDHGTCRSCRQPVLWARSATTGKAMPLEESPDAGNVVVDGSSRAHVFRDHQAALDAMETSESLPFGVTYLSHHATCPQRGQWSRAPRRQKATTDEHVQESLLPTEEG